MKKEIEKILIMCLLVISILFLVACATNNIDPLWCNQCNGDGMETDFSRPFTTFMPMFTGKTMMIIPMITYPYERKCTKCGGDGVLDRN